MMGLMISRSLKSYACHSNLLSLRLNRLDLVTLLLLILLNVQVIQVFHLLWNDCEILDALTKTTISLILDEHWRIYPLMLCWAKCLFWDR